ncbi:MAG: hypothetical protein IKC82_01470, partial [Lentisphaeria bacterium]|nr:hypothetical protein [Lentisphaeria bacterium]
KRFDCTRWMQRAAMSCFAPSTVRECTTVLDRTGTEARRESARDAPPTVRFYHNKWDNNHKSRENPP